jgi:hypothetical protein
VAGLNGSGPPSVTDEHRGDVTALAMTDIPVQRTLAAWWSTEVSLGHVHLAS